MNRIGKQTFVFKNKPRVIGNYSMVGPKEGKGNFGKYFDEVSDNDLFGEETYENVMKNYGHLYQGHQDILTRCLERIETIQFEDIMYEERYLVPQMIALEMRERFKKEPELVAKQLKQILAHEHDWTEEQALDYLGLPQREQLADDYVSKFADRMERLDIEKQRIEQEKATELRK